MHLHLAKMRSRSSLFIDFRRTFLLNINVACSMCQILDTALMLRNMNYYCTLLPHCAESLSHKYISNIVF